MKQISPHTIPLELLQKEISGKGLYHLACAAPAALCKAFTAPGQYLSLSANQASEVGALLALANNPADQTRLEFLIKNDNPISQALCATEVGGHFFACEHILGQGFALAKKYASTQSSASSPSMTASARQKTVCQHNLHLFGMGSGLAPLRAVLLHVLSQRQDYTFTTITLWQGAFQQDYLPFSKEYPAWQQQGVSIELCLDRVISAETAPSLTHTCNENNNNVIDALRQKKIDLRHSLACWAGSSAFGSALCEVTRELGLAGDALLDNFT